MKLFKLSDKSTWSNSIAKARTCEKVQTKCSLKLQKHDDVVIVYGVTVVNETLTLMHTSVGDFVRNTLRKYNVALLETNVEFGKTVILETENNDTKMHEKVEKKLLIKIRNLDNQLASPLPLELRWALKRQLAALHDLGNQR